MSGTRVVHVASGREWRGGQRQVWLLARELQRRNDIRQVVVTGAGTELALRLRADRVRVREVPWRAGLDLRACGAILSEMRRGPTLLHAHDAHALTLAGICATLWRQPLIATRRVDFHLRRRGFWARADRVIAISRAVAAILVEDGIAPDRVVLVHDGVSLEAARAARPLGIRARLGLAPTAIIAVNVAALVPHKDHDTLLRAATLLETRHPSLHWVVAGQGECRAGLERLLDELALRRRVHFLGQVQDPLALIADADLFVMSSQEEGLGTSVLDAMACGIPVASTSAGGLPEMLADGAGLLVPTRDPAALSEAVSRIVMDPTLRASLVDRARIVVDDFSDARMAAAVVSVYRSCAQLP